MAFVWCLSTTDEFVVSGRFFLFKVLDVCRHLVSLRLP
jgi:hypothetical protein